VTLLSDGQHRGLAYRLNEIGKLAKGRFLARMDADDLMHPHRLAEQVAFLAANPSVDVLGTAAYTIDADSRPAGVRGQRQPVPRRDSVLKGGLLLHPTVMMQTSWFRKNEYSLRFPRAEDHELWCRVCERARISSLDQPLLFYRETVPINVEAYARTCRSVRLVIKEYGPKRIGRMRTWGLLLRTALKECLYRACRHPWWQSWLLKRRSSELSPQERAEAERIIASIRSAPLPGWTAATGEEHEHSFS
jgi:hypothetical protein